jgi:beta-1,4-N-acetylglucosaminyltransferase
MIYVTVGTMYMDFGRLIRAMDRVAQLSDERIVIQTGMGVTLPEHCEHFDFKPHEEVLALQEEARLIVCHAGIGSVIDALKLRKPLIVVPRLAKYGEHNNDHQLELAGAVERRGWGKVVLDIEFLAGAFENPPSAYTDYAPARNELVNHIRATLLS